MGRPKKGAIYYFPLDCVLDDKFEKLEAVYGNDGFAVAIKLYQAAYQTPDGELNFNDVAIRRVIIRRALVTEKRFFAIVESAITRGLFDFERWKNEKILTSNGIKKRLKRIADERKREPKRRSFPPDNAPENAPETDSKTGERLKIKDQSIPPCIPPSGERKKLSRREKAEKEHEELLECLREEDKKAGRIAN